jgi:hypothetical protein
MVEVVEIDESKSGIRKCHQGHCVATWRRVVAKHS